MKYILDVEYRLKRIKYLLLKIKELNVMPSKIFYKEISSIDSIKQNENDHFFLIEEYKQEIKTYMLNQANQKEILKILENHKNLCDEVLSLINDLPKPSLQNYIIACFSFKSDEDSTQTKIFFIKKDRNNIIQFYNQEYVDKVKKIPAKFWVNSPYYSIEFYHTFSSREEIFFEQYLITDPKYPFLFFNNPDIENQLNEKELNEKFKYLDLSVQQLLIIPKIKAIELEFLNKYANILSPKIDIEFNPEMISRIHDLCDGHCWYSISKKTFYDVIHKPLEYMNTIKLKHGGKTKAYYLFHNLKKILPAKIQKQWIEEILSSSNIKQETFHKKYSETKTSNTKSNKDFVKNIDEIFVSFGHKI